MEALLGLGYFEIVMAVLSFFYIRKLRYDDGRPWNWPLVGMMPWILTKQDRVHDIAAEYLNRLGCTFLVKGPWFVNMDMLFTVDPANIRYILCDSFQKFHKGDEFKQIFDVLGDGIVNSEAESWRDQRRHAQILYNHHRFRQFLIQTREEKVKNGLLTIIDHVSEKCHVVDMQDVFQRLSFDITCIFVTGYDPMCLSLDFPEVPFTKAIDEAEEVIFTRHVNPMWKLLRWLDMGPEKKMREAQDTINQVLFSYISQKRKELNIKGFKSKEDEDEDEVGADLLTLYLTEEDKSLELDNNDKFVRDIVLNHIIAGRDTTSSALTWFLWLVITHPQVEAKIRQELKSKLPQNEAQKQNIFSSEELSEMSYLHAAISESLRLYPPVPFQHKEAIKPDILPSGHHVHPKLRVMFSLYAMGRMVDVWGEDSYEFKPERWICKDGSIKHEPAYKFPAFSAGPRACLGKRVAFTQIKEVAAALIYNYNFHLVEGHVATPNLSMILYMQHGLKVRVTNRWS